jgi:hypothetical protein
LPFVWLGTGIAVNQHVAVEKRIIGCSLHHGRI